MINSSNRALATPRLDSFLKEFANTDTLKRLERYRDLLPPHIDSRRSVEYLDPRESEVPDAAVTEYQHIVRGIWLSKNDRERRFFSFHLRRKLYEVLSSVIEDSVAKSNQWTDPVVEGLSTHIPQQYLDQLREIPEVAFDAVIDRLDVLHSRGLTKYCGNPECPAPYYIARRKSQRYCGDECAELFQRDAKLNWWQAHGSEWRENHRKKEKGTKKNGKTKT